MSLITPVIPPEPAAASDWQTWDRYLRAVDLANTVARHADWLVECEKVAARHIEAVAAQREHAKAQADTAVALSSHGRDTRAELVFRAMLALPEMGGLTDLNQVDLAIKRVDAYLSRMPATET